MKRGGCRRQCINDKRFVLGLREFTRIPCGGSCVAPRVSRSRGRAMRRFYRITCTKASGAIPTDLTASRPKGATST